ncbi:ceramidase domain-containing protein [Gammaproteobacteria bacterium]|nr:ceramidase domain-containing protein [Gammaproteobacteria bacterium]
MSRHTGPTFVTKVWRPMTMHNPLSLRSSFSIALALSLSFLLVYYIFGNLGWAPSSESLKLIGQISGWCERVSGGIFREPINALSNLGFMVVGLSMFFILSKEQLDTKNGNLFYGITPVSVLYAGAVIWLGPGSMLMHGTHTAWGGWADNLSMVMYILLPWLINVSTMGGWSVGKLIKVYAIIVCIYAVARWFFGGRLGIHLDLFGLSIGLWAISECLYRFWSPTFRWLSGFIGFVVAAVFGIMPADMIAEPQKFWWVILFWIPAILSPNEPATTRRYTPWYFLGIAAYILAFLIWLKGRPDNPWCVPDSWVQLHALWHLLTAAATWCFFKFLRTEAPKIKTANG